MTILQVSGIDFGKVSPDTLLQQLTDMGISLGKNILVAAAIFIVGRYVVKILNSLFARLLSRGTLDPSVQTFLRSLVNVVLTVLLVISVIGALGINTTSFAALLASVGVAVGMALSGNLQNFAGGIVILLFKPYRVGDFIETEKYSGIVKEIQIFHTIIETLDQRLVYAPNGVMSTTAVVNVNRMGQRRAIWTVNISYGNDVERARQLLTSCLQGDSLILTEPKGDDGQPLVPIYIGVSAMGDSSIQLTVRAYVKAENYWKAYHGMNEKFYNALQSDAELSIPFNTQTLHIVKD
ncbi:MAG: mechanosensitive ion channel family protein [Alloprevotella sp.]|nr:mechanosensitive ion channel family protein [Alloprevotella sp.]